VPGIGICEHLPRLARRADRFTIVRSLSHDDADHSVAVYRMLTGRAYPRAVNSSESLSREDDPHIGSVVAASGDRSGRRLPAFLTLPGFLEARGPIRAGQHAGCLGRAFDPLVVSLGMSPENDPPLRRALDLDAEPARVLERYGRDRFGRSVLLGRRLVEAGVRFVQVNWVRHLDPGWDTHSDGFRALRDDLLPPTDWTLTALLDDLEASGRLDATLVVVMGEFGRSPRIAASTAGRYHWPRVFSLLLAGAGLPGGRVYGASDPIGAEPKESPITPGQLAATFAFSLGIDPAAPLAPGSPEGPVLDLWG
jgi:hypothetical protein